MEPAFASTVVLARGVGAAREVLLLRRPPGSAFAADAWVFPGGRVDAADHRLDLERYSTGPSAVEWGRRLETETGRAAALVVAGVRETWEETGILLAEGSVPPDLEDERRGLLMGEQGLGAVLDRHYLRLATHRMTYIGRRVTPIGFARRFDTCFFLAEVQPSARCTLVGAELEEARWCLPRAALQAAARGAISMLPPTIDTLRRLDSGQL